LLILGKEFCWKMIFTLKKELSPSTTYELHALNQGVLTELLEKITDESMQ